MIIVISEAKYSGPNNVVKSLIEGATHNGEKVQLIALRARNDPDYIAEISSMGCKVNVTRFGFFKLFALLALQKDQVISTHGVRADLLSLVMSYFFSRNYVATIHNVPREDYLLRYGQWKGKALLKLHSFVFKSQRVKKICVSKVSLNSLKKLGGINLDYTYNGLNPNRFKKVTGKIREDAENNLGLERRKRVLFCGHLSDIKNPKLVVEAATYHPDVEFVFLGSGPLYDTPSKVNNCIFVGRVLDVVPYYAISDVFVMPSLTEGMPMALIEALFSEAVPVCSDIAIFREISNIDGLKLILSSNNVEDFANALNEALSGKVSTSVNYSVARQYFTSEVMYYSYINERPYDPV